MCVVHWHCSVQLSMFNMEKRYRNKIIIIIIIIIITVSNEVSRERSVLRGTVWMNKVRIISWHIAQIDTLKTETSNFVLNPSLYWKPVECSQQCCYTCMPGLTEDKSGCMILYTLKPVQFVVRDTSKKRITVV